MRKKLLENKAKIAAVIALIGMLACVRLFEQSLFYDPFLEFFKGDFKDKPLPEYNVLKLFLGLVMRYVVNMVLSLGVIYVVFKDRQLVKLTSFLYAIFFVLLMLAFFGMLSFFQNPDYMLLFYIRRFLIQPLFLVLFLPAFYYQKKVS
ncbi:exosortase F system-associated protein [Flavobacterium enshiense]|uniref:exosortase F system-associated membrane protein n=1 Tax=Flavobacterium enshiense TaxID=1341165 RepID=UPI00345D4160